MGSTERSIETHLRFGAIWRGHGLGFPSAYGGTCGDKFGNAHRL